MSNTYIHKDLGRWKNANGITTWQLSNLFDRHNNDWGERRARRMKLKAEIHKKLNEI